MRLNSVQSVRKGIAWGLVEKAITIISVFVIRTVIIKTLGSNYLGLSSLFNSIFQILNLSEFGFSTAVLFSLYKPIAEDDYVRIGQVLNYLKIVYRCIGIGITVVGLVVMPFVPRLINSGVPDGVNIYILYSLSLISVSATYLLFAYKQALLLAYQKNSIISRINSLSHLMLYILQVVGLFSFHNYYIYVVLSIICSLAINLLVSVATDKAFPQIKISGRIDKGTVHTIIEKAKGLFIAKLCVATRNTLDSIFISAFIGLTALSIYDNYYRIIYAIIVILNIALAVIRPGIGNGIVLKPKEKNFEDFKYYSFFYQLLAGWITACLLSLLQPFMYLWMGKDLMVDNVTVVIFSIYFYVLTMGDVRTLYYDACGLWWEGKWYSIIETITNILLNWIFVRIAGTRGVLLSTIVSVLAINFFMGSRVLFNKFFIGFSIRHYFFWHIRYAFVCVLVCSCTWFICYLLPFDYGLICLLSKAAVCIVVPPIIYFILFKKTMEFKYSIKLLRSLITH